MKKTHDHSLNSLLGKSVPFFEKFHGKTKIKKLPRKEEDQKQWPKEWKTIYYKGYRRFDELILPRPQLPSHIYFKKVMEKRKSGRKFSSKPLSLTKLSTLLYYGAGMNLDGKRFYPSAGARYPLEVYILSINTNDVLNGTYHYYLKDHSLEELVLFKKKFNFREFFNQGWVSKAAVFIVITAMPSRNTNKYGERGYRHILTEAGHMAQNFYLMSAAVNLSCCAIGGYVDDNINELLDVDGKEETVVYVLAVGENS